METKYDYIIIGSGFGGSVSALRLSEKGYRVLLIEKGKRYQPDDFAKTNWNLKRYLWWPGMGFYGIQKLSFFRKASILTGTGLGGGSLVYANTLFEPKDEFFSNGAWAKLKNWKEILKPYYEIASEMMGRVPYDNLNPEDLALRKVAMDMDRGHTFQNVHVGVYFSKDGEPKDPYFKGEGPMRRPCIECAACMVGCREGAKNTLDKNYLWFAEKKGVEILTETKADKIHYSNGEYHLEIRSVKGGNKKRYVKSDKVIISAGTLGTLHLLLKMKHKEGSLQKISDMLGHNLLTNSETLCAVSGISEKMNNGVAISSVFHPDEDTHIEIVKYPDKSNSLKWFFSLAVPGAKSNLGRSIGLLKRIISSPGEFIRMIFNRNWSTGMVIFLVMQTLENSMRIKWKNNWFRSGISIENSGNEPVSAYIDLGQQVMMRYARETKGIAQNIILEVLFNRPTTAHILGGVSMGKDARDSVVNDRLEVHNYPGLYIIDGSIIQTNPGVNPSLSILAMAEYAMDQIPSKKNK